MPGHELPTDWQDTMLEWVRGAAEPDASWFAGGPHLSPRAQIEVYRNQYRLRLVDALIEELPGYRHLSDDDEVLWDYLRDHPSDTWTLNRVAERFPAWLEARGAPALHVEMARLDRAVMAGFEAAEPSPLTPEQLATMPPLRLSPPVRLLRLTHNVHHIRSAALSGGEVPEVLEVDVPLVVFRKGIKMRHLVLEDGAWQILDAIRAGRTVIEALEALVAGGLDPNDLGPSLQKWFATFAELQLVEVSA